VLVASGTPASVLTKILIFVLKNRINRGEVPGVKEKEGEKERKLRR
jgi:hypothetical protein